MDLLTAELASHFDELRVWLGERPYFFADEPSAADLAIFGQLHLLQTGPTPEAAELIAARRGLVEYCARVDAATADSPPVEAGRRVVAG
jgi:glutathione S-transferase